MMDKWKILEDYIFNSNIPSSEFEAFLKNSKNLSSLIIRALKKALKLKNLSALNMGLQAMFLSKEMDKRFTDILLEILETNDNWNYSQELVCEYLETIKDPKSVDSLERACLMYPTSDLHSIPLKAIWALTAIGTKEAKQSIVNLSQQDKDSKLVLIANTHLRYFNS